MTIEYLMTMLTCLLLCTGDVEVEHDDSSDPNDPDYMFVCSIQELWSC